MLRDDVPQQVLESGQLDDWVDILLCTCKELVAYRNLYLLCEGDADDGANDKCGEGTRSGTLGILTRIVDLGNEAENVIVHQYLLPLEQANICPDLTEFIRLALSQLALLKSKINVYSLRTEWMANAANRAKYRTDQGGQEAKKAAFVQAGYAPVPRACEEGHDSARSEVATVLQSEALLSKIRPGRPATVAKNVGVLTGTNATTAIGDSWTYDQTGVSTFVRHLPDSGLKLSHSAENVEGINLPDSGASFKEHGRLEESPKEQGTTDTLSDNRKGDRAANTYPGEGVQQNGGGREPIGGDVSQHAAETGIFKSGSKSEQGAAGIGVTDLSRPVRGENVQDTGDPDIFLRDGSKRRPESLSKAAAAPSATTGAVFGEPIGSSLGSGAAELPVSEQSDGPTGSEHAEMTVAGSNIAQSASGSVQSVATAAGSEATGASVSTAGTQETGMSDSVVSAVSTVGSSAASSAGDSVVSVVSTVETSLASTEGTAGYSVDTGMSEGTSLTTPGSAEG